MYVYTVNFNRKLNIYLGYSFRILKCSTQDPFKMVADGTTKNKSDPEKNKSIE